jgi:hypothetical protein
MRWPFKRRLSAQREAWRIESENALLDRMKGLDERLRRVLGPRPRNAHWDQHHISVKWAQLEAIRVSLEDLRQDVRDEFRRRDE